MNSVLKTLRIVGFLEGISYILLLFIAVPIKYTMGDPQYVKLLGMPHGLLFVAYVVLAILVGVELKWSKKTLGFVLLASILPFGTFIADKNILNLLLKWNKLIIFFTIILSISVFLKVKQLLLICFVC
ncbi:DUF3817 domain-containing protein [Formosa haliotis]|uniref:DUF3817 domain-containing protein n=1 Tax=Formosa haliotis TaxID=1555194 RepID=UPI0009F5E1DC